MKSYISNSNQKVFLIQRHKKIYSLYYIVSFIFCSTFLCSPVRRLLYPAAYAVNPLWAFSGTLTASCSLLRQSPNADAGIALGSLLRTKKGMVHYGIHSIQRVTTHNSYIITYYFYSSPIIKKVPKVCQYCIQYWYLLTHITIINNVCSGNIFTGTC